MLKSLFPWKHSKTKQVMAAQPPMDEELIIQEQNLIPCHVCSRTFLPTPLKKHEKICEKQAFKKRKPFNSLKQRVAGTDLADFHQPSYLKKKEEPVIEIKPRQSKWKEKHMELVTAIRAAKGVPSDQMSLSPTPKPRSTTLLTVSASQNERCPSCERHFGPKAFDRHVEWCKEKQTRIHQSPASVQQAKERLEARTKYRVPSLIKTKRTLIREKYSPLSPEPVLTRSTHSTTNLSSSLSRGPSIRKPKSLVNVEKTHSQPKEKPIRSDIELCDGDKKRNSTGSDRNMSLSFGTPVIGSPSPKTESVKSLQTKRNPLASTKLNSVNVNNQIVSLTVSPICNIEMSKRMVTWKDTIKKSNTDTPALKKNIVESKGRKFVKSKDIGKHSSISRNTNIEESKLKMIESYVNETGEIPIISQLLGKAPTFQEKNHVSTKMELVPSKRTLGLVRDINVISESKSWMLKKQPTMNIEKILSTNDILARNKESRIPTKRVFNMSNVLRKYKKAPDKEDDNKNIKDDAFKSVNEIDYGKRKHHLDQTQFQQKSETEIHTRDFKVSDDVTKGISTIFENSREDSLYLDAHLKGVEELNQSLEDADENIQSADDNVGKGDNSTDINKWFENNFGVDDDGNDQNNSQLPKIGTSEKEDWEESAERDSLEDNLLKSSIGDNKAFNCNSNYSKEHVFPCVSLTNVEAPATNTDKNTNMVCLFQSGTVIDLTRDNSLKTLTNQTSWSSVDTTRFAEEVNNQISNESFLIEKQGSNFNLKKSFSDVDISKNSLDQRDDLAEQIIPLFFKRKFVHESESMDFRNTLQDIRSICSTPALHLSKFRLKSSDKSKERVADKQSETKTHDDEGSLVTILKCQIDKDQDVQSQPVVWAGVGGKEKDLGYESIETSNERTAEGKLEAMTQNTKEEGPSSFNFQMGKMEYINPKSFDWQKIQSKKTEFGFKSYGKPKNIAVKTKSEAKPQYTKVGSVYPFKFQMNQMPNINTKPVDWSNVESKERLDILKIAAEKFIEETKKKTNDKAVIFSAILDEDYSVPKKKRRVYCCDSDTSSSICENPKENRPAAELQPTVLNKSRKSGPKEISFDDHIILDEKTNLVEASSATDVKMLTTPNSATSSVSSNVTPRTINLIEKITRGRKLGANQSNVLLAISVSECEKLLEIDKKYVERVEKRLKNDKSIKLPLIVGDRRGDCTMKDHKLDQVDIQESRKTLAVTLPKIASAKNSFESLERNTPSENVVSKLGKTILGCQSNTSNYDPFEMAQRQFMELLECDDFKPFTPSEAASTTPLPHTTIPTPLKTPITSPLPSVKKISVKSAEPGKKTKRASVIDPPVTFKDSLDSVTDNDEFLLIESMINEHFGGDTDKENTDDGFHLHNLKNDKDSLTLDHHVDHRKYSDDMTSSIDPSLINENDNLSIPEHFGVDDYSPTSTVDTETTLQNDDVDHYSVQYDSKIEAIEPKATKKPLIKRSLSLVNRSKRDTSLSNVKNTKVAPSNSNSSSTKKAVTSNNNNNNNITKTISSKTPKNNLSSEKSFVRDNKSQKPEKKKGLPLLKRSMTLFDPSPKPSFKSKQEVNNFFNGNDQKNLSSSVTTSVTKSMTSSVEKSIMKSSDPPALVDILKAEDLFAVDDEMYEEYKKYEEMYLKEKEQSTNTNKKNKNKNVDLNYGLLTNSEEEDHSNNSNNKMANDSAYGSLRKTSKHRSRAPKLTPLDPKNIESSSSSGSENGLHSPALPTTNSAKVSKFCHECGTKFPVTTAKFCVECGVKRLVL